MTTAMHPVKLNKNRPFTFRVEMASIEATTGLLLETDIIAKFRALNDAQYCYDRNHTRPSPNPRIATKWSLIQNDRPIAVTTVRPDGTTV